MDSTGVARPPLEQGALQAAAGTPWTVRLLATADSTNAVAAADPARNLVVIADHQQAGRGRLDRGWVTPPGAALTFSAVVDPIVDAEWWGLVPLVAGLAVARAVRGSLKWPNDVLLGEKKVCGILVERIAVRAHGAEKALAVIGIGINVDQSVEELPVSNATSLALASGPVDRTELFGRVLHGLRVELAALSMSPHRVVGSYRALCSTLDREVRVDLPDGSVLEGIASGIDEHGRLLVSPPPRRDVPARPGLVEARAVAAGDVVHVRPGDRKG